MTDPVVVRALEMVAAAWARARSTQSLGFAMELSEEIDRARSSARSAVDEVEEHKVRAKCIHGVSFLAWCYECNPVVPERADDGGKPQRQSSGQGAANEPDAVSEGISHPPSTPAPSPGMDALDRVGMTEAEGRHVLGKFREAHAGRPVPSAPYGELRACPECRQVPEMTTYEAVYSFVEERCSASLRCGCDIELRSRRQYKTRSDARHAIIAAWNRRPVPLGETAGATT